MRTFASRIEIPGTPIDPLFDEEASGDPDAQFYPIERKFAAHHELWLDALQRVADRTIPNLLGIMPPGSAKSTYTSVVFPTFLMGRQPGTSVIEVSYGKDLPRKFGRRGRSIVRQHAFERTMDTGLSPISKAAHEWSLLNGSEFMGSSIKGGITGNRADFTIWDDPIRGREDADSQTIRNKTWDAYIDDLQTRKKPNAGEVGIATRWHEDDPMGRILPKDYDCRSGWVNGQDGRRWFVIHLAAECFRNDDPLGRRIGDRLWPEWFGVTHFDAMRKQSRTWNALYQGRPSPEEGNFFKREWLRPYDEHPALSTLKIYGASDYAVTADGNDYTVHLVIGVDPRGDLWLLDLWRQQTDSKTWVDVWCDMVIKWKPFIWAEENGQIIKGVGPFLVNRQRERKAWTERIQFASSADKPTRAQPIRGMLASVGLHVPTNADWYPDFESELITFPAGRNDDQVDGLSLIGRLLDKLSLGKDEAVKKPAPMYPADEYGQVQLDLEALFKAEDRRMRNAAIQNRRI